MERYFTKLDEIDQWLFNSFGILPGACSSTENLRHTTARMVAEALWPKKDLASAWTEEDDHVRRNLSSLLTNLRVGKKIEKSTWEKYYEWLKTIHVKPRKPRESKKKKDIALTAGNIKRISDIIEQMQDEGQNSGFCPPDWWGTGMFYEEVLRRYNESKRAD